MIGRSLMHYPSLDSTSDLAKELATDPANHGAVVLADFQTRGRGQYGRVWQAPPGSSLLMSAVLIPPANLVQPVLLTALAAVAVCETLTDFDQPARIKWPNDVHCRGKKICGTLIECGISPHPWVVMGIGLNLNQSATDFARLGLHDAVSLHGLTGQEHDRIAVAQKVINHLNQGYERLLAGDADELERHWRNRIGLLGSKVQLTLHPEQERIGRLRELGFDGLVIETIHGGVESVRPETVRQVREVPQ